MSRLTDLIAQAKAKDTALGEALEREFRALSSRRAFGLNFERHRPESVELPGRPVRKGDKVRVLVPRGSKGGEVPGLWRVIGFEGKGPGRTAHVERIGTEEVERRTANFGDLIVVAEFLYPAFPR